jgi:hypothetical protein
MHLYGALVDSGYATPYETVPITTISAYTGYTSKTVYITQSGIGWELSTFSLSDVSGSVIAKSRRHRTFNVTCFPFTFEAGTIQDLEDFDDLMNLIDDSNFLWVRFEAGSRNQPSTTDAYPIYIESLNHEVRSGTHGVSLVIRHRYRY